MKTPRVTVLMSVHDGGRWLRPAIDSVLAQTWTDFEFIIIDDASTDDSAAQVVAANDPRIRLVRLPENIGLTRSLNVGLREARGEFLARHDSDDLSGPQRLTKQVAFLETRPTTAVVGAQGRLIDADGRSRGNRNLPLEATSVRWLSLFDNPVIHTAAMFRAAMVRDEFGGYDESFATCQDYDLWTRIMARYEVRNLPERLVEVREHGGSISALRRSEGTEAVRRVVGRIATKAAGPLTAAEAELAVAFRRHIKGPEVTDFRALLTRWDASFPGPSVDLDRTRAGLLVRLGYNLLSENRGAALRQIWSAIRMFPPVIAEIPWPRVAALAVLGERARRLGR